MLPSRACCSACLVIKLAERPVHQERRSVGSSGCELPELLLLLLLMLGSHGVVLIINTGWSRRVMHDVCGATTQRELPSGMDQHGFRVC